MTRPKLSIVTPEREADIYGCFDGFADIYPDKSTDWLLQMTADTMKCSYHEAAAALQNYSVSSTQSGGGK